MALVKGGWVLNQILLAMAGALAFEACAGRSSTQGAAPSDAGSAGSAGAGTAGDSGTTSAGSGGSLFTGTPICFAPASLNSICTSRPTPVPLTVDPGSPDSLCPCVAASIGPTHQLACLPPPPAGQSCEQAYPAACIGGLYGCGLSQMASDACGPLIGTGPIAGQCCYALAGSCPLGRPLYVHGEARRAPLEPRADWLAPLSVDLCELSAADRSALADYHASEALAEHASVASFGRFLFELLSLGAPAELVSRAQRAISDEIEHAQLHFALASSYAGRELGPGPLDIRGVLEQSRDFGSIVLGVVREGCIAETVSAQLVAAARDQVEDGALRARLARVADDELEHVLLAWQTLAWLMPRADAALRARIEQSFAEAERFVGFGTLNELSPDSAALARHGYLDRATRRDVARRALSEIVRPAARALAQVPARRAAPARLAHA